MFATVRELADGLQRDLVPLRRTLTAVVGRADRDFQKLRAEQAGLPDEDDDPDAPTPPTPVVAAAPGAARPGA